MLRGGYGLFLRRARSESAGHAILGQLSECAGGVVADDYGGQYRQAAVHDQHSDSDRAASASLAGFTAANPFVGTLRSQAFDQAADPMVHQYNFNIQYQLTDSLVLETSYSGLLGRDLSSMFINVNQLPFSAAIAGKNKQANRPFPNINGTVIPVFSNGDQQLQCGQFPHRKALLEGLGIAGELHHSEEPGSTRVGAGFLHAERDQHRHGHLQSRPGKERRADRRAAVSVGERELRAAVWTGTALAVARPRGQAHRRMAGERHPDVAWRLSHEHPHQRDSAHLQYL